MILEELYCNHFKNHRSAKYAFHPGIQWISGPNGSGKTNLLDAIWYLANARSLFLGSDQLLVEHRADFFRIQGQFLSKNGQTRVEVKYPKGGRKEIILNGKGLTKYSELLGKIPLVLISPFDQELLHDGSEERRKFMDSVISQVNSEYFHHLKEYQRILDQRNAWLKSKADGQRMEEELLEHYDRELSRIAKPIFETRKQTVSQWQPLFQKYYRRLSGESESVLISYSSSLQERELLPQLRDSRRKDEILKRTQCGIHKDDLDFELLLDENSPVAMRKFASQGQQKTLILAMKFSVCQFLSEMLSEKAILLLDDVFDKLDTKRSDKLLELLHGNEWGQIIIADTNENRVSGAFPQVPFIRLT